MHCPGLLGQAPLPVWEQGLGVPAFCPESRASLALQPPGSCACMALGTGVSSLGQVGLPQAKGPPKGPGQQGQHHDPRLVAGVATRGGKPWRGSGALPTQGTGDRQCSRCSGCCSRCNGRVTAGLSLGHWLLWVAVEPPPLLVGDEAESCQDGEGTVTFCMGTTWKQKE